MSRATTTAQRTGLLRDHDFRQLFLGDTLSQLGAAVVPVAMPLVAVAVLDASAFEVGLLATFGTLATLLISLPAGAWVDRMARRRVMMASTIARAALMFAVPLAWWTGMLSIPVLFAVAFLAGVAAVFFDSAYQSYLPALVDRQDLVEANARLQTVQSVASVTGPGLAGVLVNLLTAPFALLSTAFGYVWSAACLALIRKREPQPEPRPDRHLGREIAEGLAFLLRVKLLRHSMLCTATFNLFWNMGSPMRIVLLSEELRLSPTVIGLVLTGSGIGGVLGGLAVRRIVAMLGQGPAVWIGAALAGLSSLTFPLAQDNWLLLLAAAGQLVASVGIIVYNVSLLSFRQAITPSALMGRISSGSRFLVMSAIPLGTFVGGVLGAAAGPRATLAIAGAGATLSFLWIFFSPMRSMRDLPRNPGDEPVGGPASP